MTELPLAVCRQQHHLGLARLWKLLLLFLIIGQQLRVLTGLILQAPQPNLRDGPEFSGFRQGAALLQQARGFIGHCLVDFAFFGLHKIESDHATAHRRLRF